MRVANQPLDKAAVDAANKESARRYSPQPVPGDPAYPAFRANWMDSYVAAGGTCREEVKGERKARIQQDRAALKGRQGNRGAALACPLQQGAKPPTPRAPPTPGAPPAPTKKSDCPCDLTAMTVSCSHGRSAKNDLLMVVPNAGTADAIGIQPAASGDSSIVTVRADGQPGFPKAGSAASSFTARGALAADGNVFSLWRAAPVSTFVSAEACGVALHTIKVDAYPPNKVAVNIDVTELREKYKGILAWLPIDQGEQREPIRKLGAPRDPNWKLKKKEEALSAEAAWKEDKGSNLAYCEMTLNGGFDPLIGTEAAFPVYGVPVPAVAAKYIKGGIYVNVSLAASLSANCAWAYWPDERTTKWANFGVELEGAGSIELAAELLVCSPDVLNAKAGGKCEATFRGWGEKESEQNPAVKFKVAFAPLTAALVFKMAWGLCEYEHSWPIFEEIETKEISHVFD